MTAIGRIVRACEVDAVDLLIFLRAELIRPAYPRRDVCQCPPAMLERTTFIDMMSPGRSTTELPSHYCQIHSHSQGSSQSGSPSTTLLSVGSGL